MSPAEIPNYNSAAVAKEAKEDVMTTLRTQESRVRRLAQRNGYLVRKLRGALGLNNHGLYMLVDPTTGAPMVGWDHDATLDDIEEWLCS